jgi:hypothetical protein
MWCFNPRSERSIRPDGRQRGGTGGDTQKQCGASVRPFQRVTPCVNIRSIWWDGRAYIAERCAEAAVIKKMVRDLHMRWISWYVHRTGRGRSGMSSASLLERAENERGAVSAGPWRRPKISWFGREGCRFGGRLERAIGRNRCREAGPNRLCNIVDRDTSRRSPPSCRAGGPARWLSAYLEKHG